ncbi:hypothetical protein MMC26_005734 [Xylographa opegraphella]|nr:hypothetical protein [Xylographa opegraphella]
MRSASKDIYGSAGYKKIKNCCKQAVSDGFDFVWVDTCCIDKSSSSELSEAINSMYRWYFNSQVCYTYLVDVPSNGDPGSKGSAFTRSRWFTRGWTLQELLAPESVIFYSQDWVNIGTKGSLQVIISERTGINFGSLLSGRPNQASVGQRMSWASRRQTTRIEDAAYCLMGIFGVNMPLLYGEGEKTFSRLQQEIIKSSGDHTIFSWTDEGYRSMYGGMLALQPAGFAECGHVESRIIAGCNAPYAMTNKGLRIELPLLSVYDEDDEDETLRALMYPIRQKFRNRAMRLYLPNPHTMYLACYSQLSPQQ